MKTLGRVMIIDDEEVDRMIYDRIIARSDMADEVLLFDRATRALDYLTNPDTPPIQLILLDINMPHMSGFDFLDAMAQRSQQALAIPVIVMLTTSLAPADIERAKNHESIRGYLQKPFREHHLIRTAEILRPSEVSLQTS